MALTEEHFDFKDGEVVLSGLFVFRKDLPAEKLLPVVVIMPEWLGFGEYGVTRARMLAHEGYLAFAGDPYGKGVVVKDHEEAGKRAGAFWGDRAAARSRVKANFDAALSHKRADKNKTFCMGYCFGGLMALELARSGADVKGVASFHGNLSNPNRGDVKNIKGKVFIFHGSLDPLVPRESMVECINDLDEAKVDHVFVDFGRTVHSFTAPHANVEGKLEYNPSADRRSYNMLLDFLHEVFDGEDEPQIKQFAKGVVQPHHHHAHAHQAGQKHCC